MKKFAALTVLMGFFALPTAIYASGESYVFAKVFAIKATAESKPVGMLYADKQMGGVLDLTKDKQSATLSSETLAFTDKNGRTRIIIGLHSETGNPAILFLDENKKVIKSILGE